MYRFDDTRIQDLEDFLLDYLGLEFLLPQSAPEQLVFFHNGDKMTINIATWTLEWEPIEPGSFTTSRLALCLHQWFAKGLITEVKGTKYLVDC